MEAKMENELKKATENQEKKDDPSESNNKDSHKDSTKEENTKDSNNNNTTTSLSANPNSSKDNSDTKGSSQLLRERILKVKASLQKKLKEEGQQSFSSDVMHTMKPGTLLCERGGFIEVSKKLSNGIKPNSNISIANLNTLPLTNLSSDKQRNMAEALSKFYAKGSLETIKESEDESPTATTNTNARTKITTTNTLTNPIKSDINKSITPTFTTSITSNPLASSSSTKNNNSLLKEVKHETEERNGFSNIIQNHKEDDLFNMLLSSSDIISHHDFVGTGSFNPTLTNSIAANTPITTPPSLTSAIVHPSDSASPLAIKLPAKSDHPSTTPNISSTSGGHASISTPSSSTANKKLILTSKPSSSLGNKAGKGRDCNEDEVFAEFDVDANLSQRHLISLQDIFFAHEINPQHIFSNSSYSSEVLENLICVLAENDHSIIE